MERGGGDLSSQIPWALLPPSPPAILGQTWFSDSPCFACPGVLNLAENSPWAAPSSPRYWPKPLEQRLLSQGVGFESLPIEGGPQPAVRVRFVVIGARPEDEPFQRMV